MPKTIYKYPLPAGDHVSILMPLDCKVLTVQVQQGVVCMWAVVDDRAVLVPHHFEVRGTGHPLGDVGAFIATFQLREGALVFHVFHSTPR